MKLNVKNFLGCKNASIENDRLTIISGVNHQGKSSILKALSLTLSQELPKIITKKNEQSLVFNGQGTSTVEITNNNYSQIATFPNFSIKGNAYIKGSLIALGLEDFTALKEQDKVELIRRLLSCNPKKTDLLYALRNVELKKYPLDSLWDILKTNGWQASNEKFQSELKALRKNWSYLTNENFGTKKYLIWLPSGFTEDLRTVDTIVVEKQLQELYQRLEQAIANQAVSDNEIKNLTQQANEYELHNSKLNALEQEINNVKKQIQEYEIKIKELPEIKNTLLCPHCAGHIIITAGQLTKADNIS